MENRQRYQTEWRGQPDLKFTIYSGLHLQDSKGHVDKNGVGGCIKDLLSLISFSLNISLRRLITYHWHYLLVSVTGAKTMTCLYLLSLIPNLGQRIKSPPRGQAAIALCDHRLPSRLVACHENVGSVQASVQICVDRTENQFIESQTRKFATENQFVESQTGFF